MKVRSWSRSLAIIAASLLASSLAAQGVDYTDYRRHTVHFPLGDRSFADEVVSYAMGHPEPQPANGRDPEAALGPPDYVDKTQSGHVFPWLLPDGRTFLYQARGVGIASQVLGLFVGRLDGSSSARLSDANAFPAVFAADHLIFTRQGRLVAQPFDATTLTLKGEPFRVDAPTGTTDLTNGAGFAVSASVTGSL